LAGVIGLARAVANVDQFRFYISAVTIVRETNWIRLTVSKKNMLRTNLPQPGFFDGPSEVRAHQTVMLHAIDRELFAMGIGKAVLSRALQNELRRLVKLWRCRNTMQASQVAQVLIGSSAARLVSQCRPLTRVEERLLAKSTECSERNKEADQAEASHKVTRIALTLRCTSLHHIINCHPERSERPVFCRRTRQQVLRFAQDDNSNYVPKNV